MRRKQVDFSDLVGKKITHVVVDDHWDDRIEFGIHGAVYYMYHEQDCCESVDINDIDNDLQKLVGTTVINAEVSVNAGETDYGTDTWTFYKITNDNADHFTIRWYGESNGWYSESVGFYKEMTG